MQLWKTLQQQIKYLLMITYCLKKRPDVQVEQQEHKGIERRFFPRFLNQHAADKIHSLTIRNTWQAKSHRLQHSFQFKLTFGGTH